MINSLSEFKANSLQKASYKKLFPVQQHSSLSLQRAQDVIWHHIAAAVPAEAPDTDVETEESGSWPGHTLCK